MAIPTTNSQQELPAVNQIYNSKELLPRSNQPGRCDCLSDFT